MTAPVTTAMASAAAPLVPHEVANTVSQTQTALDPFAPWALLVVLVWRRSFTRYEAIAALRNAIYACELPGVQRLMPA